MASLDTLALSAIAPALAASADAALNAKNYWEVAKIVGAYYNQTGNENAAPACRAVIDTIRNHQGEKAKNSTAKTTVVFGTSGWRGVIGEDFTLLNVHKVVRGIIEMMKTEKFLQANGYHHFAQVQSNGILLLRDNRFLGDAFIDVAVKELAAAGVKIYNAGMCPTGVGSAVLVELKAAGSINFTPSHNPMDYAGLKFNPADGGPAGPELTTIIEEKANALMNDPAFEPASGAVKANVAAVDAKKVFVDFVGKNAEVFDLPKLRAWLRTHQSDFAFIVDFMHGAARGYVEAVLGADLVDELQKSGALVLLHTDDDYSFHGVKPEPSAVNQAPLIAQLQKMNRPLSLAVALDPDADRIRFADAALDIEMNCFGAIAYANLLGRGITSAEPGIASTAPSSDFALEIAKRENKPVYEFAVGFKNFRPVILGKKVLVAFEESDGITCAGHTLEKCALAGLLLALNAIATTGKNLSEQYRELRQKYGWFYPAKTGADVKGVSVEAWEAYKKKVIDALQHQLYKAGDQVKIGAVFKKIADINIIDGLKVIFADRSWILLRPSGTEPKFRYYYELAGDAEAPNSASQLDQYKNAAADILAAARKLVDGK
ncbi:MAG: phosphomannomutase [Planctomycetota bacterium]|jgi:phosphomannomutase|nr:phosphomannomutase [Planctomycetota bacterium]